MLIRFRPDVIALQPKVVVILAGTNDIAGNTGPMSLEEIEANLTSMSELARTHAIKVVLASVLPVYDGGHNHEGKEVVMTDRVLPKKSSPSTHGSKNIPPSINSSISTISQPWSMTAAS